MTRDRSEDGNPLAGDQSPRNAAGPLLFILGTLVVAFVLLTLFGFAPLAFL